MWTFESATAAASAVRVCRGKARELVIRAGYACEGEELIVETVGRLLNGATPREIAASAKLIPVKDLVKNVDGSEVLAHLTLNIANYYGDMTQREIAVQLADYLARGLEALRPEEASAARALRELVKNQRLG